MLDKPIVEHDYYDAYKSITHSKNRYLAHHSFRFRPSKLERFRDALHKHSNLDSTPTQLHTGKTEEQLMNLRPRLKEKEIGHSPFRHTAKTRIEHVYDQLSKRTSIVIAQKDLLDHDSIIERQRGKSSL